MNMSKKEYNRYVARLAQKSPLELFEALYLQQNNQPMSDEQRAFAAQLMEEIQEAQP